MYNVHGFSPAEIAIGATPKFSNAIDDRLPATEEFSVSKTVADHLSVMVKYTKADSRERISRGLETTPEM